MKKVVLLHQDFIDHYRVPIYNYLSHYLLAAGYDLSVISAGVEKGCPHNVDFKFCPMSLNSKNLFIYYKENRPDAVIFFVTLRSLYLFPSIFFCKALKIKTLYWGHGRDLIDLNSKLKNFVYWFEHVLVDSIILYAEHLRQYVSVQNSDKVFIANNTLNLSNKVRPEVDKGLLLKRYGIKTTRNILFVGRLQKRKKIDILLKAHSLIHNNDVGLVIVGPAVEIDVDTSGYRNVYKIGPIYGDKLFELMGAMDVYCMPGWVGLSIVDAFFMGLPLITQEGAHPPEISYLKDGINGYVLSNGDISLLAKTLEDVLLDEELRKNLSRGAFDEYENNMGIDRMCEGFLQALNFVFWGSPTGCNRSKVQ